MTSGRISKKPCASPGGNTRSNICIKVDKAGEFSEAVEAQIGNAIAPAVHGVALHPPH